MLELRAGRFAKYADQKGQTREKMAYKALIIYNRSEKRADFSFPCFTSAELSFMPKNHDSPIRKTKPSCALSATGFQFQFTSLSHKDITHLAGGFLLALLMSVVPERKIILFPGKFRS